MFSKKCPKCNEKISRSHSFCPSCGFNLKKQTDKDDYGMLGLNDFDNFMPEFPFDSMMNKMLKSAMKMMEKQMQNIQTDTRPMETPKIQSGRNVKVQFYINGKKINLPNPSAPKIIASAPKKKILKKEITQEQISKFAKLPKKEPKSKMRRLSEKLIYELEVPGVENINDIFVNQLENSVEIKALSKNKVYSKILNINLPMLGYKLDSGNLTLEFQTK